MHTKWNQKQSICIAPTALEKYFELAEAIEEIDDINSEEGRKSLAKLTE